MDQTIKPKTLAGHICALSGLFITSTNPSGLTPKELQFITAIATFTNNEITKDIKIQLANQFNYNLQVTVNYINKLKRKGVITKDDKLHPIFSKTKIIIEYGN